MVFFEDEGQVADKKLAKWAIVVVVVATVVVLVEVVLAITQVVVNNLFHKIVVVETFGIEKASVKKKSVRVMTMLDGWEYYQVVLWVGLVPIRQLWGVHFS